MKNPNKCLAFKHRWHRQASYKGFDSYLEHKVWHFQRVPTEPDSRHGQRLCAQWHRRMGQCSHLHRCGFPKHVTPGFVLLGAVSYTCSPKSGQVPHSAKMAFQWQTKSRRGHRTDHRHCWDLGNTISWGIFSRFLCPALVLISKAGVVVVGLCRACGTPDTITVQWRNNCCGYFKPTPCTQPHVHVLK